MVKSILRALALAGLAGLGLSGCNVKNEPAPLLELEAAASAEAISTQVQQLAAGVAQSASFVNGSSLAQDAATQGCAEPPCTSDLALEEPARRLSDWLKAHLFNGARRSADSTATRLVFCFAPEDLCAEGSESSGSSAPEPDAPCASALAQVPICVAVTSAAPGEYDGQLLVGKSPVYAPASFHLRANRLALELELAEVKSSFEALFAAQGKVAPEGFPTALSGRIGGELVKTAAQSFTAKVSILEPVALDLFPASDARHSELRAAVASPLTLTVDGAQKLLGVDAALGAVDLRLAAELLFGRSSTSCASTPSGPESCTTSEEHYTGAFLASLPGLSGSARLQAASALEALALTDLSLGDSTARLRFDPGTGAPTEILSLDINPTLSPRRFSLSLSRDAAGTTVQVAPLLDVRVSVDLQVLASQFADIPGWALKATTRAHLFGSEPALFFPSSSENHAPRVKSGSLELTASGMLDGKPDVSLSISSDQCLADAEGTFSDDDHPFSQLAAGACAP